MSINQKIWAGFGTLLAIFAISSGIGYVNSRAASAHSRQLMEVNLAERDAAAQTLVAMQQAAIQERGFILAKQSSAVPGLQAAVGEAKRQLTLLAKVTPHADRRANANKALAGADAYLASFQKVVELETRRGLVPTEGLEGTLRSAVHEVEAKVKDQGLAELSVIMLMCRRHEKDYLLRGDPAYLQQIAKCIAEFSGQMKQFSIGESMQKEVSLLWANYFNAMKSLVDGDKEIQAEETVLQGHSLAIQAQVKAIEAQASADLEASSTSVLAELDFAKRVNLTCAAVGGILGLLIAWAITRTIVRALRSIAGTLAAGAEQTATASLQVSSASQSLAEGASEQAASLEETSASLEEMTSMVKRNAEAGGKAKTLANETRTAADTGSADMAEMKKAMNEIKASSSEVAKIVKDIDEIAFQTNILALNAAVEAARAGEAGMGFAVVADEVRNLAQRSAKSAKETAAKIEDAITKSERGVQISNRVAVSFEQIAIKTREVDQYVAEIASASHEQAQGVSQVNIAVTQMDKVTQSNAASAEECASAAEELSSQAASVKDSVNTLQQLVGGGASQSESASPAPPSLPVAKFAAKRPPVPATRPRFPAATGHRGPKAPAETQVSSTVNNGSSGEFPMPADDDFKNF